MIADPIDRKVLELLETRGRMTWAELGESVGLSPPAVAERVRRLEERGVIRGYAAMLDARSLGLTLTAFIGVTLERPKHRRAFLELVDKLPEIQECHHVAGDYDFLLKVRCRDTADLEKLISERIKGRPGAAQTRTTIVLSTCKETPALPVPGAD